MLYKSIYFWEKFKTLSSCALMAIFSFYSFNAVAIPQDDFESTRYVVGISPEHKFMWFRVAKVGSTTIKSVFRKNHVSMPFKSEHYKYHPARFKHFFKFAFVRNPWDRVVSCYCQKVEEKNPNWAFYYGECFDKGFEYFVDFIKKKDLRTADRHIRLQTKLVPCSECDFIGHLENFEADFQYVLSVLGVKDKEIPKKNPSNHAHYSAYYNDKTREIIAQKYKDDIEAFDYQFEYR